jgi:hypothetical protein
MVLRPVDVVDALVDRSIHRLEGDLLRHGYVQVIVFEELKRANTRRSYSRERGGTAAPANSLRATGAAYVRMRKASLLRRERLLSILVGGK